MGYKRRPSGRRGYDARGRWSELRPRPISRADVVDALRALSQDGRFSVRREELSAQLNAAIVYYFGSIIEARRVLGIPTPRVAPRWTRARVIRELTQLHKEGTRLTRRGLVARGRQDLLSGINVVYGSLIKARHAAGVPEPEPRYSLPRKWSAEIVLIEIIKRHEAGLGLASSQAPDKLVSAGFRYFGDWETAITAVGLDYDEIRLHRRPYTRAQLVRELRELAHSHPNMLASQLRNAHPTLTMRAERWFGSIENACRAAGVTGWPQRARPETMSRTKTLARIRERHARGEPMYRNAILQSDGNLFYSARRYFWAWDDALDAAGVPNDSPKPQRWNKTRVIAAFQERQKAGLSLATSAVYRDDAPLYTAALRYFGSYRAAIAGAGVQSPYSREQWTREKIIERLRDHARDGVVTVNTIPGKLVRAIRRYFGSMDRARKAAGVPGPKK